MSKSLQNIEDRKVSGLPALPGFAGSAMEVRPRTTGEILDEATRLVLADAPLLLASSGLFFVPVAAAVLLLLTHRPSADWWQDLWLPAVLATLFPLTGLGSGACQEVFRRRADGKPVTLASCLTAALRHGLDHIAARSLVWVLLIVVGTVVGALLFPLWMMISVLPSPWSELYGLFLGVTIYSLVEPCVGGLLVHPLIADGELHWASAWWTGVRQAQRQIGKALALAACRPFILIFAALNLYLLVGVALWVADNLAGIDATLLQVVLSADNRVYTLSLVLLVALLMVPLNEATNYLFHTDARARYEGLDLWFRVRRLFPAVDRRVAVLLVLALGAGLLAPSALAADSRLDAVRAARKELAKITQDVKGTEPYRNGNGWLARLNDLAAQLDRDGSARPGSYRWVSAALAGFQRQDKDGALRVLRDIDNRLALIEESLSQPPAAGARSKEDIRALMPPAPDDDSKSGRPAARPRPTEREERERPEERPIEDQPRRRARQGSGAVGPSGAQGFGPIMWMVIAAALVGTLVAAVLLYQRRRPVRKPPATGKAKPDALSLESLLSEADKLGGEGLWRQADDLARGGKFLDAVRTLYLAVLAVLHRADLIRYSPTRTNGEYVRQLREKAEVQRPFRGLTGLFEIKWYGERHCDPADYDTCRRLAEQVRAGMTAEAANA